MSENQQRLDRSPDQEPQVPKIDLAKYRTADLVDRLTDLISVPEALNKIAKTAPVAAVFVVVAYVFVLWYAELTFISWIFVCIYSVMVGVVLGIVLGFFRVIATAMHSVESILRIVLEISGKAAVDYEQIQAGGVRMPTGYELIEQIYDDVVLPSIEQAVANGFGFLSWPILKAYRMTIGWAVRYFVKRLVRAQMDKEDDQQIEKMSGDALATIAHYSERIQKFASSASDFVGKIGRAIRFYAMLPLYIVFGVALALATVPILVVLFLAG